MFEQTHLSIIWYWIIAGGSVLLMLLVQGYIYFEYNSGKPLAPFLWIRVKRWTNSKLALFEIFTLTNNISLEPAIRETGDAYHVMDYKPHKPKYLKKYWIFGKKIQINANNDDRKKSLIMPKSTYSINAVPTIPLLDLHPTLHEDAIVENAAFSCQSSL